MMKLNQTQIALFFQHWLLRQQRGWGEPKWALQELERLMQWQILRAPDDRYKRRCSLYVLLTIFTPPDSQDFALLGSWL